MSYLTLRNHGFQHEEKEWWSATLYHFPGVYKVKGGIKLSEVR
jgi:hypothetical protein